ncbi:hypothetical protein FACS189490_09300 [Clostridia bacterium]|nr:hypothetical protein FACS189490_09300 [Clostridia bacterium]
MDNASGVAAIIGIANKAAAVKSDLGADLIFCAFNGEETGCKGSEAFVNEIKEMYDDIFVLNVDCVGLKEGKILLTEEAEELNRAFGAFLESKKVEFGNEFVTSDSGSFNSAGISAITVFQEGLRKYTHFPLDSLDNIAYSNIEEAVDLVFEFAMQNSDKSFVMESGVSGSQSSDERIKELRESLSLDYDEIYVFKDDKTYVTLSYDKPLSLDELNTLYPNKSFPEKIGDMEFQSALFQSINRVMGGVSYSDTMQIFFKEADLEQVLKIDKERNKNLSALMLDYKYNDEAVLRLWISNMTYPKDYFSGLAGDTSFNLTNYFVSDADFESDAYFHYITNYGKPVTISCSLYRLDETSGGSFNAMDDWYPIPKADMLELIKVLDFDGNIDYYKALID